MTTVTNDFLVENVQNSGLYYGFTILVAATVGRIITAPGQSACIGKAIYPIGESLGVTPEQILGQYYKGTMFSSAALLTLGPVIDKLGPRKCVVASALGLAYGCYCLAQVQSIEGLLLPFFALRFFGQGVLMSLSVVQINYWWIKRRNVMLGFSGACLSLGMLVLVPGLMDYSIASVNWRQTYTRMALMCVVITTPWGFLWYRGRPEEYGVQPDGKVSSKALQAPESWTPCEALCTCSFWIFAFAQLSMAITYEGFWFYFEFIFDDALLGDDMQSFMKTFMVGSMVVSQIASDFILDRVQARSVMVRALIMSAASLVLACTMFSEDSGRLAAFLVGALSSVSMSLSLTVFSVVYASYFGRKHLGAIQTVANSFTMFGYAIGPYMWGVLRESTGVYSPGFASGALLQVLCAFAVYCGGAPPLRKAQEDGYMAVSSVDNEEDENTGDVEESTRRNEQ